MRSINRCLAIAAVFAVTAVPAVASAATANLVPQGTGHSIVSTSKLTQVAVKAPRAITVETPVGSLTAQGASIRTTNANRITIGKGTLFNRRQTTSLKTASMDTENVYGEEASASGARMRTTTSTSVGFGAYEGHGHEYAGLREGTGGASLSTVKANKSSWFGGILKHFGFSREKVNAAPEGDVRIDEHTGGGTSLLGASANHKKTDIQEGAYRYVSSDKRATGLGATAASTGTKVTSEDGTRAKSQKAFVLTGFFKSHKGEGLGVAMDSSSKKSPTTKASSREVRAGQLMHEAPKAEAPKAE